MTINCGQERRVGGRTFAFSPFQPVNHVYLVRMRNSHAEVEPGRLEHLALKVLVMPVHLSCRQCAPLCQQIPIIPHFTSQKDEPCLSLPNRSSSRLGLQVAYKGRKGRLHLIELSLLYSTSPVSDEGRNGFVLWLLTLTNACG